MVADLIRSMQELDAKNFAGNPAELDRLRRELKVPDPDPAETEIRLGPPAKKNPAKAAR